MSLRPNIPIMVVSVLISVTLWLVVYARDLAEPLRLHLHVNYIGLDTDNYYVDRDPNVNQSVANIKFLGPAERLDEIKDNLPTVEVDLSQAKEGKGSYQGRLNPISDENYLLDKDITIRVLVEKRIRRDVRVEVKPVGTLTDQSLALDSSRVQPRTATVIGPVSMGKPDHQMRCPI